MDDGISQAPPAQESKFLRRSGRTSQSVILVEGRKFTVEGRTYYEKPLLMLDEKKLSAAAEKHADELFRQSKLKLDAEMRQKNIGDVESGKKGSY
ncbi:hypothetical protein L195_g043373 [Trifolium pratense]|uniref:Uncharacterized protein n=1 Tax=Trifolium pratense TaxID=57577 RepID=A0A2K3M926_TRIPR|nr:hypothetical protein L195_g043373 [Trifolium pratense]